MPRVFLSRWKFREGKTERATTAIRVVAIIIITVAALFAARNDEQKGTEKKGAIMKEVRYWKENKKEEGKVH